MIYGHDQPSLKEQVLEPELLSSARINADSGDHSTVTAPQSQVPANEQFHELRNGKTYSQITQQTGKRSAHEMIEHDSLDDTSALKNLSQKTIRKVVRRACKEQPEYTYNAVGSELCDLLGKVSLSSIGPDNDLMDQYKMLCGIAESFRTGTFVAAIKAMEKILHRSTSVGEDMEVSDSNGIVGTTSANNGYNVLCNGVFIDHMMKIISMLRRVMGRVDMLLYVW